MIFKSLKNDHLCPNFWSIICRNQDFEFQTEILPISPFHKCFSQLSPFFKSSPEKKLGQIVVKFVIFEDIVVITRPEKIWQNGPFFTPAKVKKVSQIVVFFTIFERIVSKPEKNPSQTVQFGVFVGVTFTSRPEKNLGQRVKGKKIRLW